MYTSRRRADRWEMCCARNTITLDHRGDPCAFPRPRSSSSSSLALHLTCTTVTTSSIALRFPFRLYYRASSPLLRHFTTLCTPEERRVSLSRNPVDHLHCRSASRNLVGQNWLLPLHLDFVEPHPPHCPARRHTQPASSPFNRHSRPLILDFLLINERCATTTILDVSLKNHVPPYSLPPLNCTLHLHLSRLPNRQRKGQL
jgi:hypothetical protein